MARRRPQPKSEADRYREATEQILAQLEWAIGYLRRIGKRNIAASLERNREVIARRLR
jgi:hypothetical protein